MRTCDHPNARHKTYHLVSTFHHVVIIIVNSRFLQHPQTWSRGVLLIHRAYLTLHRQLHPALPSRERNVSTPSGSCEFSSTRGYRWETTSQKFLKPAPLPHMRSESYDLTASSPMSSTSLLEQTLLLPFFMPRLHGMDSQMKVIASVSSAALLGCDVVDICLGR